MTAKPKISVLLCTFNDESYLKAAIESILAQTFTDFELIIINDGSTDQTKQIIASFTDSRIRYFEHQQNKGLEQSKNRGIEEARGKYIAYMDGDDISLPQRLEMQFNYLEAHPEVGLCGTAFNYFGTKEGLFLPPETDQAIRVSSLFGTPLPHPTCMIRAKILQKFKIRYTTDFPVAEDHPFMLDLLDHTKAYGIQTSLFRYRWHEQKVSLKKKRVQADSSDRAGHRAFARLLGLEVSEQERQLFKNLLWYQPEISSVNRLQYLLDKIETKGLQDTSAIKFRQYIKQTGYKKLFNFLESQSPQGLSIFFHFIKSKIWKDLPLMTYGYKYFQLLGKSLYYSFQKAS